jgi:hypothetical protein
LESVPASKPGEREYLEAELGFADFRFTAVEHWELMRRVFKDARFSESADRDGVRWYHYDLPADEFDRIEAESRDNLIRELLKI